MQPLIGITCSYDQKEGRFFLPEAYTQAVIKAGGVPVIMPGAGEIKTAGPYLKAVRGLVLAGGGDVDPAYFQEEPMPGLGEITPDRDRFEILLIKAALRQRLPILAICRGIQILNVACGGSLFQHIPAQIKTPIKHSQAAPRWHPTHRIFIDKASRLAEILGAGTVPVNSFHHQAVKDIAPGFRISAISSDGVIEAIEHPGYRFVIGVQWHPEGMVSRDAKSRSLMGAFIASAKKGSPKNLKKKQDLNRWGNNTV